ncbi:MAG: hypothetical protein COU27_02105 [Candidatus Levybacteria bacterium CG10_big_fil_rev_8_21_14_0_10_36_7]|nr:MAG: hypothetical protein COU27_02105 [Candidatus Levybacteria bacterium CG10_big_fil_rev_8_21_14_0_10_36_7]
MKILSWNIWKGTFFDKVLTELEKIDADILCLQEVKIDSNTNQAEKIAEKFGYNKVAFSVFTTDRHTPVYTQSNTILSKKKIESFEKKYLSTLLEYKKDSTTEPRGALKVNIDDFTIICTHLGFSQHLLQPTNLQKKQLTELKKLIPKQKCILAGDFNSGPESEIIKNLEKVIKNTDNSDTPTRNALKDGEGEGRIDYIFVTPDIKFKKFEIIKTDASDHNILTLTL